MIQQLPGYGRGKYKDRRRRSLAGWRRQSQKETKLNWEERLFTNDVMPQDGVGGEEGGFFFHVKVRKGGGQKYICHVRRGQGGCELLEKKHEQLLANKVQHVLYEEWLSIILPNNEIFFYYI